MPEGGRRLLERLSLTSTGFRRSLVLDLAQVEPTVVDAGIFFDQLIGSWVDQQEKDRFSLSPLLSDFASNTLTVTQRETVNFEIANSLVKPLNLGPIEANSAFFAAWAGKNEAVMVRLCLSIIGADNSELKMISPHFLMLTQMRVDKSAYASNDVISQMVRGAQLLLLCYEGKDSNRFRAALEIFERETEKVSHAAASAGMALVIYSKLLLADPVFGALPGFGEILRKLDALFENQGGKLPDIFIAEMEQRTDTTHTVGFMFLNQARQVGTISELASVFNFLDACDDEFRAKVFKIYDLKEIPVDVDMIISGAWLREHEANTINSSIHSSAYASLERLAAGWARYDLAVACRKYQAIILDEYGNDKEAALAVLDAGLEIYGLTNSELIRAKAKVLYRANDHQGSLELSARLIEDGAPLSETEKAFLGRETAISAEKQADFVSARRYYLFGASAAEECGVEGMMPMHIGLLADAALASWHSNDRVTCLRDLMNVMKKLEVLDPKSSLRAAHCHAVSRHLLLWLDQEATGEAHYIANGELPRIYPGIVSNPEPHPNIAERFLPPLEISWYMLAKIECHCLLDLGISQNIEKFLKGGPVREGQILLTGAMLDRAYRLLDVKLFVKSLADTITHFAFLSKQGAREKSFNIENVTYAGFPKPTAEEKLALTTLAEQQILTFASACLLAKNTSAFDTLLQSLAYPKGFARRDELLACLAGASSGADSHSDFAALLAFFRKAAKGLVVPSPYEVFEFALKTLQLAKLAGQLPYVSQQSLIWLEEKWQFVWARQRFLLMQPALYERPISLAWSQEDLEASTKAVSILVAILPTIHISNKSEIEALLKGMSIVSP